MGYYDKLKGWKEAIESKIEIPDQEEIQSEVTYVNRPREFIDEKLYLAAKTIKEKRVLIIVVILIPLLIFLFILGLNLRQGENNQIFYLNIGDKDLPSSNGISTNLSLLSGRAILNGESYREILENGTIELNLDFKRKESDKGILELGFIGFSQAVYLEDNLIIPNLENYVLEKEFLESYLFRSNGVNSLGGKTDYVEGNYVKNNFYGASLFNLGDKNYSIDKKIDGYSSNSTKVNYIFVDNLNLVIYTENGLNLNFSKKDLNKALGRDEYVILIRDEDKNLIFNKTYSDDGILIDKGFSNIEQKIEISLPISSGVYYISFLGVDTSIKNLEINTNKILIFGDFKLLNKSEFYTYSQYESKIKVGDEEIKIKEGENIIEISEDKEIKYNRFLSPKKENWFDISFITLNSPENADLIILGKSKFELTRNNIIVKTIIPLNESKISLEIMKGKTNPKISFAKIEII